MDHVRPRLFIFNWPSHVGGADTKLTHLLLLLHKEVNITVCPNDECRLSERFWCRFMDRLGIRIRMLNRLPQRLEGYALSLSNGRFFTDKIAHRAKDRGLKIIWSSEMMWHHPGEEEAVREGIIDHVLYVSPFQKASLAPGYGNIPFTIVGNYIDPKEFPWRERKNPVFTVGRLSRPAPEKYPEDFPVFYEALNLPDTRYRVMAWSDELARKYRWHRWTDSWDLLGANEVPQLDFLASLDLFVYPLGHRFRESWGRSVVEAMLTGCVPLVPIGHHFEHLIEHGVSGFLCNDISEWREHSQRLRLDFVYRSSLSTQAHEHAVKKLCNPDEHRNLWLTMLASVQVSSAAEKTI